MGIGGGGGDFDSDGVAAAGQDGGRADGERGLARNGIRPLWSSVGMISNYSADEIIPISDES